MHYRLTDARVNGSINCSKSYKKMVKICSVVFELKWAENEKCAEIGQYSFIWHTGVLKRSGISQF